MVNLSANISGVELDRQSGNGVVNYDERSPTLSQNFMNLVH